MNTKSQRSSAFTLVELIVVITILAILGTIGFLSLQGYSKSARESGRTSDLATLSKGLDGIVAAGMMLPRPDSTMVTLTASGTVIGYQGYAGKNVLSVAGVGGKMQDPLDGLYYTYLINAAGTRHQVLALYEDAALAAGGLITPAYAGAYDLRAPGWRWAALGVLLWTGANLNQPIQEWASFTGVDMVNTANSYVAYFSKGNTVSGTWAALAQANSTYSCKRILESGLSKGSGNYMVNPAGISVQVACDMTTDGGGWTQVSSVIASDADRLQWRDYVGGSSSVCLECNGTWPKYVLKDAGTYRAYADFRLWTPFKYSATLVGTTASTQGACLFYQQWNATYGNIIRSESDSPVDCISDYIKYR